jgi:hypothetical protein
MACRRVQPAAAVNGGNDAEAIEARRDHVIRRGMADTADGGPVREPWRTPMGGCADTRRTELPTCPRQKIERECSSPHPQNRQPGASPGTIRAETSPARRGQLTEPAAQQPRAQSQRCQPRSCERRSVPQSTIRGSRGRVQHRSAEALRPPALRLARAYDFVPVTWARGSNRESSTAAVR